jgi:hypothetical protein
MNSIYEILGSNTGYTGFTGCTGYSGPAQIFVNAKSFTGTSTINEMDFNGLYVDINNNTLYYNVMFNYVNPSNPLNVQLVDTYSLYLNNTNPSFNNILCVSSLYQNILNQLGLTISQTPIPANVKPESFSFNNPYSLSILPSSFTGFTGFTGPTGFGSNKNTENLNFQDSIFKQYKY